MDANALEQNQVVPAVAGQRNVRQLVSCGYSWGDQKVIVVNPESQIQCADTEVGEIWTSGKSVALGYWNQPEETNNAFQAFLADTGAGPFLRTGDLGFWQDGELLITGRLKDVIIIRGCNHYPQDIESTLEQSHPAIRRPGCTAAFAVEIEAQEQLVVVAEVERRYHSGRAQELSKNEERARQNLGDRRQLNADSIADVEVSQPFNLDTVICNIRQAVANQHGLQVYAVILIKAGSIAKTSSGKVQRYACKASFLTETLDTIAASIRGRA